MKFKIGTYVGIGNATKSITGVGFKPDLVLIKKVDGAASIVMATKDMTAGSSVSLRDDVGLSTAMITSLDTDGFSLAAAPSGDALRVNENAKNFHYICIAADGRNDFTTFTYTGSGASKALTGFGFAPVFACSKGDQLTTGGYRMGGTSDASQVFYGGSDYTGGFVSLDKDGVTMGSDSKTNASGVSFYGFALKNVPGSCEILTYTGDGNDSRGIAGLGFKPDFVWVKGNIGNNPRMRTRFQTGDNSCDMDGTQGADGIQKINGSGFEVGTSLTVNNAGTAYRALCLKQRRADPFKKKRQGIGVRH